MHQSFESGPQCVLFLDFFHWLKPFVDAGGEETRIGQCRTLNPENSRCTRVSNLEPSVGAEGHISFVSRLLSLPEAIRRCRRGGNAIWIMPHTKSRKSKMHQTLESGPRCGCEDFYTTFIGVSYPSMQEGRKHALDNATH